MQCRHAGNDLVRLGTVQLCGVQFMQLLNLVLKFLCAPLGVAVSGHQTELVLHLMKGVLRSLVAVAHTLTVWPACSAISESRRSSLYTDQTTRAASR